MPAADERTKLAVVDDESIGELTAVCDEKASAMMWFAVLVSMAPPILWGWTVGYTSPTFSVSADHVQPYDLNYLFDITSNQKTWLSSVPLLACAAGGLFAGRPVDRFGKKVMLVLANALYLIGYVVFRFTPVVVDGQKEGGDVDNTSAIVQLMVARALMGLAGGICTMSVPPYTAEIAPLRQRGVIGCAFQVGVNAGLCLVYGIGTGVHWDHLCEAAAGIAAAGLLASLALPESPQWLVNKGRRADAEKALRRLRTADSDIHTLLDNYTVAKTQSEEVLAAQGDVIGELLKYPRNKALALAVTLALCQQLSGVSVVMAYGGEIIGTVYPDPADANKYALIMQLLMFGMVMMASAIMPLFNRKTFLVAAEVGMLISYTLMIMYFFDKDAVPKEVVLIGYFAFPMTFSFGMGSIPWLALGELLHPRVRGLASAICTFIALGMGFVTVKTSDALRSALGGLGGMFCLYAGLCFGGLLFILFLLPETRDKSYNAIERELKGERKAAGYADLADETTA
eukprot:TRINITY_DN7172_c0_g1_i1.p1 TRINITY_DN7172_c0_g1~~TRINITY_DN7172_c0_g1_i1.p1  ORF type:complete len:513 (+),score=188.46 TRINITY_DN7172_c0_g1_i1:44-1582(+)